MDMELIVHCTYRGCHAEVVPKYAQTVVIHPSVQVIQEQAFRGCNALTSIIIPPSVTCIGPSAFEECKQLERIEIASSVVTISAAAFYGCTSLTAIDIPDSVTSIERGAFNGCTSLTSVRLPSSITAIESFTFTGCTALTKADIPDSVKTIGRQAFIRCSALPSIRIPDSVTSIGELAFSECSSAVSLEICGSVISAGMGIFSKCSALERVILPVDIAEIPRGTFADCTSLTSIVIPDSVTEIGPFAFHGCEALARIQISKSVTSIEQHAFNGCAALETISLPDDLTSIAAYAFYNCMFLEAIEIPNKLEAIGDHAFQGCVSLEEIILPNTVTSIGRNVFCRCSSLTSVTIPFSVTLIREHTFSQCTSLHSVIIPDSVHVIGDSAFEGCCELASVRIPESVTTISWGAFAACISLATVLLPQFVATICSFAFAECERLTCVMIPESLTSIGETSFEGCTSLALITIPHHVKMIGDSAFSDCPILEQAAQSVPVDVVTWLRRRFHDFPLHDFCHRADISRSMIEWCIKTYPDSVRKRDSLGMSALYVLLLNNNLNVDMVQEILRVDPTSVQLVGPLGRYPLHLASLSPSVPLSVIQLLSSSYTKDGQLALTVPDHYNDIPCALALRYNTSDEVVFHLFERYPLRPSNLKTANEKRRFYKMCTMYFEKLSKETPSTIHGFHSLQRHGWVSLLSNSEGEPDVVQKCVHLIENVGIEVVRALAHFKDLNSRGALESAPLIIKDALERRLQNDAPLFESSAQAATVTVNENTVDNSENDANDLNVKSLVDQGSRSIGENRFRKLLKRFNIDLNVHDEIGWMVSQNTRVELCRDVLDNLQPLHQPVSLLKRTEQLRRQIELQCNIRLDSSYHFGANYHIHEYVGRVVKDALMSFRPQPEANSNSAQCLAPAVVNHGAGVSEHRPIPIRLREFSRQLTEAISMVPLYNKNLVNMDEVIKSLVHNSCHTASEASRAMIDNKPNAEISSSETPPESRSPPNSNMIPDKNGFSQIHYNSQSEHKRINDVLKAMVEKGSSDVIESAQSDANEATFFAVKTYLTEQVLNAEQNCEVHQDSIATVNGRRTRVSPSTNLAFRVIRRFCPGVPKNCIPQSLVRKVENFVSKTKPSRKGQVHALTRKNMEKKDLLEFLAFLKLNDDTSSPVFNKRRIKHKLSGKAVMMYVAKEASLEDDSTSSLTTDEGRDPPLSAFLRMTPSKARSFGPLLHSPSFLLQYLRPSQIGSSQESSHFLCLQTHSCKASQNPPFMYPLFPLPCYHRQMWYDLLHWSNPPRTVNRPPTFPFLHPLYQLSSLKLRSWQDLFYEPLEFSQPVQQFLRPLLQCVGFRQQD